MGCANTKAGGAAVAEEGSPEGGDAHQKDVPKVMVDGGETTANGNVVNSNGIEDATAGDEKEPACNGDVGETKRKSKIEDAAEDSATTPSGDKAAKSALNGEEAKMADEDEETGDNAQPDEEAAEKKDESSTADNEAADDSRNSED